VDTLWVRGMLESMQAGVSDTAGLKRTGGLEGFELEEDSASTI